MDGLEQVFASLAATGIKADVWIDGSFLTQKLDPEDSDIVVNVTGSDYDAATQAQIDVIQWLETDLKPQFRCDSYPFVEYERGHPYGSLCEWTRAYWIRQFGFTRTDTPKGMALISLGGGP